MTDEELLTAILAKPHLCARIVAACKPKKPWALGDNPKQRAAFLRLSPERQQYITRCDTWRKAWRLWHYFGASNPGPYPVDIDSPEAKAVSARLAELDRMQAESVARLVARWGGDMEARDRAIQDSPKRSGFRSDEAHHAAVVRFMNEESAKARAARQSSLSIAAE
jgi:hypothetical protein